MKNIILSGVLGGIAIFIWGYVYWAVLPIDEMAHNSSQNDLQLISFMEQRYDIPSTHVSYLADEQTPIVATVFLKRSPGFVTMLWQGLLFMMAAVGLIALAMRMVPVLPSSYAGRVGLIALTGLAATVVANLGDPIWFTQGWSWHIAQAGYDLSCWIVAGLVIAALIKTGPETAS